MCNRNDAHFPPDFMSKKTNLVVLVMTMLVWTMFADLLVYLNVIPSLMTFRDNDDKLLIFLLNIAFNLIQLTSVLFDCFWLVLCFLLWQPTLLLLYFWNSFVLSPWYAIHVLLCLPLLGMMICYFRDLCTIRKKANQDCGIKQLDYASTAATFDLFKV